MKPIHVGRLTVDMPFETLKCSQCGAIPKDTGTKFCGYCGSLLPQPIPVPGTPIEAPERFEAVLRHPDLPRLLQRVPLDSGAHSIGPGVMLLVTMVVISAAMLPQITSGDRDHLPAGILLLPGAVALFAVARIRNAWQSRSAPLRRNVAVILDDRVKVSGGGQHSSAITTYYLLLAERDGMRVEIETSEEIARRTAPGDIGVAYIRNGRLVDFTIVRT
jgi:hypothetical protein